MYTVCIDPGHGGNDRANKGPTGYVEADGVLDISLRLKSLLTGKFDVRLTRETDKTVALYDRPQVATDWGADLMISIHTNAATNPAVGGIEIFHSLNGEWGNIFSAEAKRVAQAVLGALAFATGLSIIRGIKTRLVDNPGSPINGLDWYAVIRRAKCPTIIIEAGFHTNPQEEALLKTPEFRQMVAEGIADALIKLYPVQHAGQQSNNARLIINNQEIPGGAILINGKSYVWTRGFAEALGHTVSWDAATRTVYVDSEPTLPRLDRYPGYDVITCRPSQVVPATIKGILTVDGINGGYNPIGALKINGQIISERVTHNKYGVPLPPRTCLLITDGTARIAKVDRLAEVAFVDSVLGAGPALLPEVAQDEGFLPDVMTSKRSRVAVGINGDGLLLLVATGPMTLEELSDLMSKLGCEQAFNCDGGSKVSMRHGGEIIRGATEYITTALILKEG